MNAETKATAKNSLISAFIAIAIVVCGLLIYRSVSPNQSITPKDEAENSIDSRAESKKVKPWTLGISSEVYSNKFSDELQKRGLDDEFIWNGLSLEKNDPSSEVESYSTKVSDNILATFVAHDNGELISITYVVGRSDIPEKDLLEVLSLSNITADILNPEGADEVNKKTLASLITKTSEELVDNDEAAFDASVNGIKFSASITKKDGLWVYFEPELKSDKSQK